MAVKFSNNGKTTLASGITNSATSITVNDGSVFPSLSGSDTFFMTLEDASGNTEIVSVSAVSSNTLTVTRAQEGTTARAFSTGDKAENRLTAAGLNSFVSDSGDTMSGDLTVSNLITSGNVDGRDVSVDGAKLDGIAANATAVTSLTDLSITDGTNGQALKTDGNGNFSFGDVTSSVAFSDITGKPTTLSGYGITDAFSGAFNDLTGKPTTIAGYGITDAFDGATTSLTGTNFSASSAFQFLNGGAAQDIKTRSVYAGTSYSAATSNAGEMDALNGYRVNGGVVFNNGRNLFHTGQYNYNDTNQWIWWTGQTYGNIRMAGGNANGYSGIEFSDSANDTTLMIRNSDGLNGVYRADTGSWFWYSDSSNNWRSYGNVTAYASDERLKTNFKPIQSALEKVCSLDGVYYEWDKEACERTDFTPEFNKTELGFKAQQVQKYFPEVAVLAPFDTDPMGDGVNESKSGENYLTLHYERLVPALVEAIKELKDEIEELKAGCCHAASD